MHARQLTAAVLFSILNSQFSISAQQQPTHDITKVDPAPLGGSIATPLTSTQQKKLKKYDLPELVGARQALGSQLIDGRLPRPLLDYSVHSGKIEQRISLFEGGLVVVRMNGVGGPIRKRVILPAEALQTYLDAVPYARVQTLSREYSRPSSGEQQAFVRIYSKDEWAEVHFDPSRILFKTLQDGVTPLQDLLRAISEDRAVTNTVANYEPKPGDELVGDDRRTYRVERVARDVVVLHCLSQPTILYIAKKDLYNYFIGARERSQ